MMNTIKPLKHEPNRKNRLVQAIFENNVDEALRLIKETGMTANDINSIVQFKPIDYDPVNYTLLIFSIDQRFKDKPKPNVDIVRALVEAGADVNMTIGEKTPLFYAIISRNIDIVRVLIAAGADINKGDETRSPMYLAIGTSQIEIVRELLRAGADINKLYDNGDSYLHMATYYGTYDFPYEGTREESPEIIYKEAAEFAEIMRLLIAAGADVNKANKYGKSPLHIAMNKSNAEIIKMLIDAGADINKADKYGKSPLDLAISRNYPEIIKMLIDAGVNTSESRSLTTGGKRMQTMRKRTMRKRSLRKRSLRKRTMRKRSLRKRSMRMRSMLERMGKGDI